MPKTRYNFTVEEEVLEIAKKLAEDENRSVSNFLENLIKQDYTRKFIEKEAKGENNNG